MLNIEEKKTNIYKVNRYVFFFSFNYHLYIEMRTHLTRKAFMSRICLVARQPNTCSAAPGVYFDETAENQQACTLSEAITQIVVLNQLR